MLKMALLDCAIYGKCCSVDRGRGIWQLKSPHRREFAIQGKKNGNARGSAGGGGGGGGQLELTDVQGVDSFM